LIKLTPDGKKREKMLNHLRLCEQVVRRTIRLKWEHIIMTSTQKKKRFERKYKFEATFKSFHTKITILVFFFNCFCCSDQVDVLSETKFTHHAVIITLLGSIKLSRWKRKTPLRSTLCFDSTHVGSHMFMYKDILNAVQCRNRICKWEVATQLWLKHVLNKNN